MLWLENLGKGVFADHELISLPGCIHVPVDDYDNDGDPDIAALISQNDEEVLIFENPGNGSFNQSFMRSGAQPILISGWPEW